MTRPTFQTWGTAISLIIADCNWSNPFYTQHVDRVFVLQLEPSLALSLLLEVMPIIIAIPRNYLTLLWEGCQILGFLSVKIYLQAFLWYCDCCLVCCFYLRFFWRNSGHWSCGLFFTTRRASHWYWIPCPTHTEINRIYLSEIQCMALNVFVHFAGKVNDSLKEKMKHAQRQPCKRLIISHQGYTKNDRKWYIWALREKPFSGGNRFHIPNTLQCALS